MTKTKQRTARLEVRITPAEAKRIAQAASVDERSVSSWVRRVLLKEAAKVLRI